VRLVFGHDAHVAHCVEHAYGASLGGKPGHAWGIVDTAGTLRGAFLVTHEHDRTWELHVYGRTSNDTVRAMFSAVFGRLGCYRLQIRTSRRNKAIRRAAPKYGFQFEGVARHFYGPGEDALCFYMTPETCRWIKTDGKPL
jgi:RimJ/RimL family protein N-acetyltransferase